MKGPVWGRRDSSPSRFRRQGHPKPSNRRRHISRLTRYRSLGEGVLRGLLGCLLSLTRCRRRRRRWQGYLIGCCDDHCFYDSFFYQIRKTGFLLACRSRRHRKTRRLESFSFSPYRANLQRTSTKSIRAGQSTKPPNSDRWGSFSSQPVSSPRETVNSCYNRSQL